MCPLESVIGDAAVFGGDREARLDPSGDPAREVSRVPSRGPERLRRHRGTRPQPALEHDGPIAGDRLCPSRQALELDVARPFDVARLALVVLAYVDQIDLTAREELRHLIGREIDLGVRKS